jgi:hypothetical protein
VDYEEIFYNPYVSRDALNPTLLILPNPKTPWSNRKLDNDFRVSKEQFNPVRNLILNWTNHLWPVSDVLITFENIPPTKTFSYSTRGLTTMLNSEVCITVTPQKLDKLKSLHKFSPYRYRNAEVFFESQNFLPNHGFILDLLEKAIEKVKDTEEYNKYILLKTFSDGKNELHWKGFIPGTIKIYSKDLISYYDGKSWRPLPQN